MLRVLPQLLVYVWAFPATVLGLVAGMLTLSTGGKVRRVEGTLEFWGGFSTWFLTRALTEGGAMAMTLGHVIIGRSDDALAVARAHEWVHVRQYERWGPFLIPTYLLCSLVLWLRGKRAYRDNPFEREAFENS
jgi:hypothetical protein